MGTFVLITYIKKTKSRTFILKKINFVGLLYFIKLLINGFHVFY
jgi:hypothetical protein